MRTEDALSMLLAGAREAVPHLERAIRHADDQAQKHRIHNTIDKLERGTEML